MAFDNVQIISTLNGAAPVVGWRQDLAIGDVVALALTDTTSVYTFRWELVGRPEGSIAGGPGPEPLLLGIGATATFTVDDDIGMIRDGTYIVHCRLNGGAPTDTIISVGLGRLAAGLSFNGLPLRKMGGFENQEDTNEPLVKQGWAKMLDRWLGLLQGIVVGGNPYDLWVNPIGVLTAGQLLAVHPIVRAFAWGVDLAGSIGGCLTPALADKDVDISILGIGSIGLVHYAAGSNVATFNSGGSAWSFAAGQILTFTAPLVADGNLSDIFFTLKGRTI